MKLAVSLLQMLSREPDAARLDDSSVDNALALLNRVFAGFEQEIEGKDVLDFGCGAGLQSVAMARCGARYVLGLDTNPKTLARARELGVSMGLDGRVEFAEALPLRQAQDAQVDRLGISAPLRSTQIPKHQTGFDIVVSQNSMEHFPDPVAVLEEMKRALRPGGSIFMTFGPPWLAPWGSHMGFFTRVPWVNLLFPESAVMKVRSRFISDGAMRYEDVEGGLNRMTLRRFERVVAQCGLVVTRQRYDCVKGLDLLSKVPYARELLVNHVSCVLRQAQDAHLTP